MSFQTLQVTVDAHIGHIQLNRPEALNAMNLAFWQEFPRAVRSLDASGEVRVIVISAAGKHFSAGMDLSVFTNADKTMFAGEAGRRGEAMRRLVLDLQDCLSVLEQVRMPVLAAVHGACIGGALDLICACDCRYASEEAFFTIKETDIGMTADLGTLQRLPRLISPGLVRELAYTARKLGASEAASAGLVNRVFADPAELLEGVMDVARQIATRSPLAVTGCKQMINYAQDHSLADSLNYMATWQAGMFQPTDLMLGTHAAQGQTPEYGALRPLASALFEQEKNDEQAGD